MRICGSLSIVPKQCGCTVSISCMDLENNRQSRAGIVSGRSFRPEAVAPTYDGLYTGSWQHPKCRDGMPISLQ